MTDPNEPIELPPPKADRGNAAVDDHVAAPAPRGKGQPTEGLDPTVAEEHLRSPSQGVRPETPPDEG